MSCTRSLRWSLIGTGVGLALALGPDASAQFNNQWLEFSKETTARLLNEAGVGYAQTVNNIASGGSSGTEADVDWGDLDNDGWVDLVIVRKQCFTSTGKRTHLLFMNESGVLRNRTTQYATDTDVVGDLGFNTPTNVRDVKFGDYDQDGWLDLVTATTISDPDPKHIGHPRVFINEQETAGSWNGLRFENGRFPQLLVGGVAKNPRFCSVDQGDVTGDDYPDLFFGDYDSSGAGGSSEPAGNDMNDRLLINQGNGFFADESTARMTAGMLLSAFSAATEIGDFNQDGVIDVMKDTALNPPQNVSIAYNNPANEGMFNLHHVFQNQSPYHINTGDMNQDGKLDVVISDDFADMFRLNTGNDGLGRVVWGAATTYNFIAGGAGAGSGDGGFDSNNLIVDLDNDGWADSIHCDVDVDINSSHTTKIFHNRAGVEGDAPGTLSFQMRFERQQAAAGGWLGAVGLVAGDLDGGHDVAVFDIDNDDDRDMVLVTYDGAHVWINQLNSPVTCQTDLGFQGLGPASMTVCGGDLSTGNPANMEIGPGLVPGNTMLLLGGSASLPTAVWEVQSQLVPIPPLFAIGVVAPAATMTIPIAGGGGPGSLYVQWVIQGDGTTPTPSGYYATNAVRMDFLP